MENNWYTTHESVTNDSWYAQNSSGPAYGGAPQPQKPKKKHRGLKITMITLAVLVLIVASCLIFRDRRLSDGKSSAFSFSWNMPDQGDSSDSGNGGFRFSTPDGNDDSTDNGDYSDNYSDYFDNYFGTYEAADPCTIPTTDASAGLSITLTKPQGEELTLQEIYAKCSPSIVAISAYTDETSDDSYSWGTGIVLSSDGYIVTNAHVIEGTCRAKITLQDNSEYEAQLVGYDSRSDIAVLKIDAAGLTPAEFGVSDSLAVGDDVVAIGNPLGDSFRCTMTNGIVSGIDRDISYNGTTLTLIQTNAALNEGNSGGALINMYGQVIGITNMKMSNTYAGSVTIEGVGFAIPSATVKSMADSLLANGEVTGRPALGITVGAIPESAAEHYSLPDGLYVSAVSDGSDCAKQGIQRGDVITAVNGAAVTTTQDVTSLIADMSVGDTLTLTVYRDGKTFDVTVALVDVNDVY